MICFSIGFTQEISEMYTQAKIHENAFKDADALMVYETILKRDSTEVSAFIGAAKMLCQVGHTSDDETIKQKNFKRAIEYGKKAIALEPKNDQAYLMVSRATGRLAEISGSKTKLRLSVDVKSYAEKAVEYNPNNDIAHHVIGKWNYKISDLGWAEKMVANTVLGGVPEGASFENAKASFEKAVSIKPESISHNLELARTLIALDEEVRAKEILKRVLQLKVVQSIDTKYKEEAKELLDDL